MGRIIQQNWRFIFFTTQESKAFVLAVFRQFATTSPLFN